MTVNPKDGVAAKVSDKKMIDAESIIHLRITELAVMTPPILLDKTAIILVYFYQHSKGVADER